MTAGHARRTPLLPQFIVRVGADGSARDVAADGYRLDLCITPRAPLLRVNYPTRWGPHRFEPVGDILLLPPGIERRWRDAGPPNSIRCDLTGPGATRWLWPVAKWTDQRLLAALDIASLTVRHLLRRLAEETSMPAAGSGELSALLAGQLVIELARYLDGVGDEPIKGGLSAWRLRLIDERLRDTRITPTLAELATLCGMSVRHLSRAFRASRGTTLGDYLLHSRIEEAKRLLRGDQPIKAIAAAVGFRTTSSFAAAFRAATGLRPLDFRTRVLRG